MKKISFLLRVLVPLIITLVIIISFIVYIRHTFYVEKQKNSPIKDYWQDYLYAPYQLQFSLPPGFVLEKISDGDRFPIRMYSPFMQVKIRKLNTLGALIVPKEEIAMLNSLLELDFQRYLQAYSAFASDYQFSEYPLPNRKAVMVSSKIELVDTSKAGKQLNPIIPTDLPQAWSISRGSVYYFQQYFIQWDKDILVVQIVSPNKLNKDQYNTINQILHKLQIANSGNNAPVPQKPEN